MEAITDLGDSGLLLPGSVIVFVTLWSVRARRRAIAWAAAIAFCGGAMVVLKIGLVPCGKPWLGRDLANPSGHAALRPAGAAGESGELVSVGVINKTLGHSVVSSARLRSYGSASCRRLGRSSAQ